ncbi:CGNR zinc finger domain-containing protein [Streptomyces griseosporeus]|uniref:CGNR zinc finger domain-containing protein n=1 Tax=Streptomyces griseosporeus TaxID=1910 RepID=UPI0036F8691B
MALGTATAPYELRFDAGRICLDLLATSHPTERLGSVEVLRAWIAGSGLVPPGTPLAHADQSWLLGFREVRELVGLLVQEWLRPGVPQGEPSYARPDRPDRAACIDRTILRINDIARTAPPAPRAVRALDGLLVRELDAPPTAPALLAVVARDAVELLTDPVARACLRQCAGDNCPIVYLDTSRGHRRRWCSSEICGNRERVARHRRRAASV